LNDSRVLPARLYGLTDKNRSQIELLLLSQKEIDVWEVLVKPGKKAKIGTHIVFEKGLLEADVIGFSEDGTRLVKFFTRGSFYTVIEQIGNIPLPPYIKAKTRKSGTLSNGIFQSIGFIGSPHCRAAFYKRNAGRPSYKRNKH
jgi:S-adenosylmethionine:tRNA ribosyltransferase-isomerase